MDRTEYTRELEKLNSKEPSKESLKGQKFNIGSIVRITNPKSWFAKNRIDKLFVVEYTYGQKFRTDNANSYSLIDMITGTSSAWYDESELTQEK